MRDFLLVSVLSCIACGPLSAAEPPRVRLDSVARIPGSVVLSSDESRDIARRVWLNESGATERGLVHWNRGEAFASMGIGHFIWYPAGYEGPFEETFPRLLAYMVERGARPPGWLVPGSACPWADREAFLAESDGPRASELRKFLLDTVDLQARFMAERVQRVRPLLLEAAPAGRREDVGARFDALSMTPAGLYALVDYVNFKGSGLSLSERYRGLGWGLLQVLEAMRSDGWGQAGLEDFSRTAAWVLRRRALNSPSVGQELRWLAAWRRRVQTYR